jgi:DNA-binding NarL/FixJ family response regulator
VIRVCLADDQTLLREGLWRLLELSPDVRVVAQACDGEQTVRAVLDTRPDVLLLDLRMPGLGGLDVLRALSALRCLPPTLVLTSFEDPEALRQTVRAGALGYLLKDVPLDALLSAVRTAARGESVARPALSEHARAHLLATNAASERPKAGSACAEAEPALTPREREVLGLLASGCSNREVADTLTLREGTVKNHVSNILLKLDVRDRTQAVLRALEMGVL